MKELIKSIWALTWALIVSVLMFSIGTFYSLAYSIWLTITFKKWYAFLLFWWKLIDGFAAAIGHCIYEIAYSLDLAWNVNGEILEDLVTTQEKTTFSEKNVSVSASVGKLEIEGKLNKFGRIFSKLLNFAFGQKQHAIDAWNYLQARLKLKSEFFEKRNK